MTTLRLYRSYNFRDKDPVIDTLRTAVRASGMSYQDISEASDVSTSTLYHWFHGETKRPTHAAVMAVVRALGYDLKLVRAARVINLNERRRESA